MNRLDQLKQEAQQDIQKHLHYQNDDLFCRFAVAKALEIIDKAYQAGQKQENQDIINLINSK